MALPTGQSTLFNDSVYFGSTNAYAKANLVGQCTWYVFSKAKSKAKAYPDRKLNVSNLPTCGAASYATKAKENGYTTSTTPKNDCIACWSGGHVAYVEVVEGDNVCFSEANWYSGTNPSKEIVVPSNVFSTIKNNVAALDSSITVKSTTVNNQAGTDGAFKTMSLENFKKRKSGTCTFIYLN